MRKSGFSDFEARTTASLQIANQDGQAAPLSVIHVEHYLFGNAEKTHSFLLGQDALTLRSTNYGCFEDFSRHFLRGLKLVHDIVQLDFVERVGLRYLDHVSPRHGDTLEDYIVPEARGLGAPSNGKQMYSFSETFSHVDNVKLRSRVLIQEGPIAFPPDLQPDGMKVEERFLNYIGRYAALDTDGFIENRMQFSIDAVDEQLHDIHYAIGAAFKAAATKRAFEAWDEA
jgi:uncharacterized protein (TIGR04255 family)